MSTETETGTETSSEKVSRGEYRETSQGTFRYDSEQTASYILEELAEEEGYRIIGNGRTEKAYSGIWPFAYRKGFRIDNMLSPDSKEVRNSLREISDKHLEESQEI